MFSWCAGKGKGWLPWLVLGMRKGREELVVTRMVESRRGEGRKERGRWLID